MKLLLLLLLLLIIIIIITLITIKLIVNEKQFKKNDLLTSYFTEWSSFYLY